MRPQLPETTRQEVIRLCLLGHSRDDIVPLTNVSAGSVSNIVDNWKNEIGKPEANALRELAKSIRASGLSPAQCAVGFRIYNIMSELGLDAENVWQFLSDTYKKCKSDGISPEKIASHIVDLANFADNVGLPEIEEFTNEKAAKIKALSEQEQGLINHISTLKQQKLQEEKSLDEILEEKRKIEYEIMLFNDAKALLNQFNLTIAEFTKNLKDLIVWGGEPKKIVANFEEMQKFDRDKVALREELDVMERKIVNIRHEYYSLQNLNKSHSQKLVILKEFDALGIDLMELFDTVLGISTSNGIPFYVAYNKFRDDVREQYDLKLGFECKIESLKSEIESLDFKLGKSLEEMQEEEEKKLNSPKGSGFSIVLGDKTIDLI
jgi:hypothetical protein